eukprot:190726-Hanusia_phi.AAC.1
MVPQPPSAAQHPGSASASPPRVSSAHRVSLTYQQRAGQSGAREQGGEEGSSGRAMGLAPVGGLEQREVGRGRGRVRR